MVGSDELLTDTCLTRLRPPVACRAGIRDRKISSTGVSSTSSIAGQLYLFSLPLSLRRYFTRFPAVCFLANHLTDQVHTLEVGNQVRSNLELRVDACGFHVLSWCWFLLVRRSIRYCIWVNEHHILLSALAAKKVVALPETARAVARGLPHRKNTGPHAYRRMVSHRTGHRRRRCSQSNIVIGHSLGSAANTIARPFPMTRLKIDPGGFCAEEIQVLCQYREYVDASVLRAGGVSHVMYKLHLLAKVFTDLGDKLLQEPKHCDAVRR